MAGVFLRDSRRKMLIMIVNIDNSVSKLVQCSSVGLPVKRRKEEKSMVLKRIAALALALALAQAGSPVRAEEAVALPEAPGAEEVIVELEADDPELAIDGAEALWLDPEEAELGEGALDDELALEVDLALEEADGAGRPVFNAPGIPVDAANFPDSRFRDCVSDGADLDRDGRLSAD